MRGGIKVCVTGLQSSCWPAGFPPTTEGQSRATYRRGGGGRQKRQDASTGDNDVVHHLGNEVDRVVDKDDVLVAVHKIHHWFGRVAEMQIQSWNGGGKKLWETTFQLSSVYSRIILWWKIRLLQLRSRKLCVSSSGIKCIKWKIRVTQTHLLHTCTSVSRANSRSVSNLWCIGDHLNSGIRNMVVRGPGLNCRRCSSVMGMPLKPKSTRRSRSSWAAVRPWRACNMVGKGRGLGQPAQNILYYWHMKLGLYIVLKLNFIRETTKNSMGFFLFW